MKNVERFPHFCDKLDLLCFTLLRQFACDGKRQNKRSSSNLIIYTRSTMARRCRSKSKYSSLHASPVRWRAGETQWMEALAVTMLFSFGAFLYVFNNPIRTIFLRLSSRRGLLARENFTQFCTFVRRQRPSDESLGRATVKQLEPSKVDERVKRRMKLLHNFLFRLSSSALGLSCYFSRSVMKKW